MQSQNRMFDDFVKVMNGAAGTLAGATREAEASMKERAREWIGGLDMVSREEFDAVKAIAVAAREESQALRLRLEALEAAQSGSASGATARPASPRGRKAPGSGATPGDVGPA